jgi:guanine nucleotide-binding protein subunit beta-2-like 1 protein
MSQESLSFRGTLKGHAGWVTAISTTLEAPDTLLSSSRDKSIIIWTLTRDAETYGVPSKMLKGYRLFCSLFLYSFCLSASSLSTHDVQTKQKSLGKIS